MGKLGQVCAFVFVGLVGVSGCGNAAPSAADADLRRRVDEQSRRSAAVEHKLDELENRVFLLTDQVESQKVAALHREPRALPVVRLEPRADESADAAPPAEESSRPTLRIDGTRVASTRPMSKTLARHDEELPVSPDDNLGMAPAPPIRDAERPSAVVGERSVTTVVGERGGTPIVGERGGTAANERVPSFSGERSASSSNERSAGAGGVSLATGSPVASERSAPALEPIALYRQSYEALRAGRHDEAARGFREFVRRFPRHDYADNAQYWLGECFYDQKRYEEAAPQFRAVLTRWPTGNKAPDAMLKLGFTLLALGRTPEARATLRELPAAYPHTEAARLASERLAALSPTEGTK